MRCLLGEIRKHQYSPSASTPVLGTGIETRCPLSTRPVSVVGVGGRLVPAGTTVTTTEPASEGRTMVPPVPLPGHCQISLSAPQ